jgi:hypothetical protein
MDRLVDYVLVCTPTDVLQRFPRVPHPDFDLPPSLPLFVFPHHPSSCTLSPAPQTSFHSFALTKLSGERVFAFVAIRHQVPSTRLRARLGLGGLDAHADQPLTVPVALVVISHHAYHRSFVDMLVQIVHHTNRFRTAVLHRIYTVLEHLQLQAHLRPESLSLPTLSLFPGAPEIAFPSPSLVPLYDVDYALAQSLIDVPTLFHLLSALLLEQKVAIVGAQKAYASVCMLCECLVGLLYPFEYVHVYIPLLPQALTDVLDAPVPFLVGLASDDAENMSVSGRDSLYVYNVTTRKFTSSHSGTNNNHNHQNQNKLPLLVAQHEEIDWPEEASTAAAFHPLRKLVLSSLLFVLRNYPLFESASGDSSSFDADAFAADLPRQVSEFGLQLSKTSMFERFLRTQATLTTVTPADDLFTAMVTESVRQHALSIGILASTSKRGWLVKCGQLRKSWKKRFFVLSGEEIKYFSSEACSDMKGVVKIAPGSSRIVFPPVGAEDKYPSKYVFVIEATGRKMIVCASSEDERREWVRVLRARMMDTATRRRLEEKGSLRDASSENVDLSTRLPVREEVFWKEFGAQKMLWVVQSSTSSGNANPSQNQSNSIPIPSSSSSSTTTSSSSSALQPAHSQQQGSSASPSTNPMVGTSMIVNGEYRTASDLETKSSVVDDFETDFQSDED